MARKLTRDAEWGWGRVKWRAVGWGPGPGWRPSGLADRTKTGLHSTRRAPARALAKLSGQFALGRFPFPRAATGTWRLRMPCGKETLGGRRTGATGTIPAGPPQAPPTDSSEDGGGYNQRTEYHSVCTYFGSQQGSVCRNKLQACRGASTVTVTVCRPPFLDTASNEGYNQRGRCSRSWRASKPRRAQYAALV